ncbi:hypothetical protein GQ53DRAFT_34827 [Thozetella sp. PMI_491]|nr:hypothetical protein GQ53DRAFT_34827 [Thozetella sp. PMI_491]
MPGPCMRTSSLLVLGQMWSRASLFYGISSAVILRSRVVLSGHGMSPCSRASITLRTAVKSAGCSCGDTIHDGPVLISSSDPTVNGRNTPCTGNMIEYCSGTSVLQIYHKQYPLQPSTTKAPVVTTVVCTGTPTPGASIGSWKYGGCASDATTDHALGADTPYYYRDTKRMTVESCLTYCSNRRLPLAGLQNGELCYCGGTLAVTSAYGAYG